MKKLLSILLSLLMICAVLPGGALAETEPDDDIDESPEAFWRGELGKGTIENRGDFQVYVQDDLITLLR